jgi:hypothetical protein
MVYEDVDFDSKCYEENEVASEKPIYISQLFGSLVDPLQPLKLRYSPLRRNRLALNEATQNV